MKKIIILIIAIFALITSSKAQFSGGNGDGFDFNIFTPAAAVYISTNSLNSNTFCAGAVVNVSYTASGTFSSSNTFTAQLSNSTGSFDNPIIIGILASTSSGTITCYIPTNTQAGTGYRIRVNSGDQVIEGSDNGRDITIFPANKIITLKLFLHGLWNGTSHKYASVTLELRQGTSLTSSTITTRKDCHINSEGILTLNMDDVADGSYYVVIRASGYLPVAIPGQITLPVCEGISHDFTTSEAQSVAGANVMIYSNGAYQMRTGDFNGDIWISTVDLNTYFKASYGRQARSSIPAP